jgi:hypothetical protein
MLDTEFMETQSLIRSTTVSAKATLSNVQRRSGRSQLILETQFE